MDQRPDREEIEAELKRLLGSRSFAQAERHRRFLRHIVEESLRGRRESLRGHAIAMAVFDRGQDFDAQADALVRIEAGRLRQRLAEYYAGDGRDDPVRIAVPRGAYVPVFEYAAARAGAAGAERGSQRPAFLQVLPRFAVPALLVGAIAAIAASLLRLDRMPDDRPGLAEIAAIDLAELPDWPRVFVADLTDLSGDPALAHFAAGITDEIMLRLREYELLVITGQAWPVESDAAGTIGGLRQDLAVDYVLSGSLRSSGDRLRILPRLVDARTGILLWGEAYESNLSVDSLFAIQESIASDTVRAIALPYGPIFESEFARLSHDPPERLDTYDCMLKYFAYRRAVDVELIAATTRCFEDAVSLEPGYADAWGGLALMRIDGILYGPAPPDGSGDAIAGVLDAARRALDLDSNSVLAHRAMARVRFLTGDLAGFARSMERLLALARTDPQVLVGLSQSLIMIGDIERGAELARDAWTLDPNPGIHHYIVETLLRLSLGDHEAALRAALNIDAPTWYPSAMFVAIAAGLADRGDIAARAVGQLQSLRPGFSGEARRLFLTFNLSPQLTELFIDGLRRAGLEIDS